MTYTPFRAYFLASNIRLGSIWEARERAFVIKKHTIICGVLANNNLTPSFLMYDAEALKDEHLSKRPNFQLYIQPSSCQTSDRPDFRPLLRT